MTRARLRALSVIVLSGALVLAGCSNGTETAPAAPSPASTSTGTSTSTSTGLPTGTSTESSTPSAVQTGADGALTGRTGTFSFVPPDGWTEATDQVGSVARVDLVVLSAAKVGGFSNNVVVLTTDGDEAAVETKLEEGKQEMATAGRTVTDVGSVQVDGETANGFSTAFEQQGINVLARSYAVHHGAKVYLLTLSSSQQDAAHADQEFGALLSTWAWR